MEEMTTEEIVALLNDMPSEEATDVVDIPNQDTTPQIFDYSDVE